MPNGLNIGIVSDWSRGARDNAWGRLLDDINTKRSPDSQHKYEMFQLADLILSNATRVGAGFFVERLDVLVINWDAANGDPEFGSHLALAWLEHRRPEILHWASLGGLLIVEGQAILSVPSSKAYDGLIGSNELPVCGPEDPLNPLMQSKRIGGKCRKTRRAPTTNGFDQFDELQNFTNPGPTHATMFPGLTGRFLTSHIDQTPWHTTLYRGWFRFRFGRGRLPWVSILKTADRGFLKNHSTMEVAKIRPKGAVFVTTMFLATTGQRSLVNALLDCAGGNTKNLPDPRKLSLFIRSHLKEIVVIPIAATVGYGTGHYDPLLSGIIKTFAPLKISNEDLISYTKTFLVFVLPTLIIGAGIIFDKLKKFVKDIIGY